MLSARGDLSGHFAGVFGSVAFSLLGQPHNFSGARFWAETSGLEEQGEIRRPPELERFLP